MLAIFELLPPELFRSILTYLTPEDVAALAQTCHQMNRIVKDEFIWQIFFLRKYRYFLQTPQYSTEEYLPNAALKIIEPSNDCTWQEYFRQRAFQDKEIRKYLYEIISNRLTRTQNVSYLSSTYGLLCYDTLQKYYSPSFNSSDLSHSLDSRKLTREYYSLEISRLISRDIGLNLLHNIKQQQNLSTEGKALINALYIIQCFHPYGIYLSLNRLNQIAKQLLDNHLFHHGNLQDKCQLILSTMKLERFLPENGGSEYYDLENSFLYSTFHGKPTIPLTLVSIFCALAEQCGLKARPIGFPGEVMAQVESLTENSHPLIISVFDSKIITLEEINERLADVLEEPLTYPLPITSIIELIIRSARNMINSITRYSTSTLNSYGLYAAVAILKILNGGALPFTFDSMINILKEHFFLDTKFFEIFSSTTATATISNNDLQLTQNQDLNLTSSIEEKRRRNNNMSPKFFIGRIFQHRQYHYWGVICGWDYQCAATPIWQVRMGVANLTRGASQPFYHILANDRSKRYVAEDNIDISAFDSIEKQEEKCAIMEKLSATDDIGKYFEKVDVLTGKFLPNIELCQEYPDDFL